VHAKKPVSYKLLKLTDMISMVGELLGHNVAILQLQPSAA